MHQTMRWLLCVFMAFLAAGCTAPPTVTIESVEIVGQQGDATALLFHAHIENKHTHTLRLMQYEYTLVMGKASVYQGRHAAEMTLTPNSERRFTLPAAFPNALAGIDADVPTGVSQWTISGSLLFIGDSVLAETVREMGYQPSVGFSASGDLQWPPPVASAH